MANRVPLVVDTSTLYIKELPTADNLDLTGSGIVGLTGIAGTSGNFSGIVTAAAFFVDANEVISNSRQLKNIASLDATTTATIESAIAAAPNDFTSLNVSGISTFQGDVNVGSAITISASAGIITATSFSGNLALSDVTGLGANVATFLATPSSSNLASAVTDETGSGALVFATSPTLVTPSLGIASATSINASGIITATGGFNLGISSAGASITSGSPVTTLNFVGAGNTFAFNGTTVDISIAGGGGGGTEEETVVASTSPVGVTSFVAASYRSASYLAQITQGSNYQVGRYLLIHDGTTVTVIEESAIATGSMLGSFDGTINGSNVELRVTMTSASSATVTVKADTISIPV